MIENLYSNPVNALAFMVILSWVAYRLTRFFISDSLVGTADPDNENGNENPTSPVAVWVDRFGYDDEGHDRSFIRGKLADLATCQFCLGFHVSWIVLALFTWSLPWTTSDPQAWVLYAFGVAGLQAFIGSRMNA